MALMTRQSSKPAESSQFGEDVGEPQNTIRSMG